jgi:iron-sulfur cluster insertion protein
MNTATTVKFTDQAALKIKEFITEESNPKLFLRVYIQGGGCSGFQYGFTLDEAINDDDFIVTNEQVGVKLVIDAMSEPYLKNAEIDFMDNIEGAHFVIRNPNAKTTCGCGSSFSIEE